MMPEVDLNPLPRDSRMPASSRKMAASAMAGIVAMSLGRAMSVV
jgi:hypothetical protein